MAGRMSIFRNFKLASSVYLYGCPGTVSLQRLREESGMRSNLILRGELAVCFTALLALLAAVPSLQAQGGEPQYFAIRGARGVPVSGPPVENASIVISRGLITAMGRDVAVSPVAIPVVFQTSRGFGGGFPSSIMGVLAYVHQLWLDTEWSTKAQASYEKNPRNVARPRYDRTEAALADALEDHALVLIPANNSVQLRRALELVDRWHVNGVIYGGQMAYEVASEIATKKLPVLVNLKWPEADKDADPEDKPSLRTLQFRDRAPSSPAALVKASAKFAFFSGGITAPKAPLKAAKKSIDAGLAPDAALRALTLSPAEIFGVADRLGSLENGKIANLVVTDGDLFEEKTKIKMVFVDGHRFEVREPEKPKEPPKGDLTGKWTLSYTTPDGPEEATAELAMDRDGTISGTVTSKRGTASVISGYLSVDKFSFTINIPLEGSTADVIFAGTFDGTSLKGSISVR